MTLGKGKRMDFQFYTSERNIMHAFESHIHKIQVSGQTSNSFTKTLDKDERSLK